MNICFAYQLANAIQHLSDLGLVHGDIATRNCLFFTDYTIKLTDCAMALPQYAHEYWLCQTNEKIPLRWLAPEALTVRDRNLEKFCYSCRSRHVQQVNRMCIRLLLLSGRFGLIVY